MCQGLRYYFPFLNSLGVMAFAELKKEGAIVSPVRCKWQPA